jgi:hypothetical protein
MGRQILNVLGGAVLPTLYGLLGAGAAVVRTMSARIRESLLSPRHLQLTFVQLTLGALIGGCIGRLDCWVRRRCRRPRSASSPASASTGCSRRWRV